MTKQLLDKKNTEYEYVLLEDLSMAEQGEYLNMARKKGMMTTTKLKGIFLTKPEVKSEFLQRL